ncbi:tetratricopeptide repeat protein [Candidatus Daviesbacteria bacterium]|nr:tetratricopeptide repeat protein [Candidatus Daviesbacteria bacterium]
MIDSSLSTNLSVQAIEAALDSRWKEALKLNSQIIKSDAENVDALNRLARAYFELGNLNLAKKYYQKVLKFDPYNPIAQKNLKIIQSFKKGQVNFKKSPPQTLNNKISPNLFLHEPGKTKVVTLLKVAEPQRLSETYCGMPVLLQLKQRGITVVSQDNKYLGVLPDDISYQLLRLIKGGNKYESFVKSVKVNGLSIIIREVFRSRKFKNQPSFLDWPETTNLAEIITPVYKEPLEEEMLVTEEE